MEKWLAYEGEKTREIVFPLGGIGTGCVGLAGNGRLLDWEIANRPNKGFVLGHSNLAVKAVRVGRRRIVEMPICIAAMTTTLLALGLTMPAQADDNDPGNLMLVLDSSGSMKEPSAGTTKIAAAKDALNTVIDKLPAKQRVGLRVYGAKVFSAKDKGACTDSQRAVDLGTDNRSDLKSAVAKYKPYGETPTGYALQQAGKDLGADRVYAWPSAEIAVMGAEGAAAVVFRKDIASAEDPEAKRAEVVDAYRERFATPFASAAHGYVDDIIDPADTRRWIMQGLKSVPARKSGDACHSFIDPW